jgi:polyhydroxybutyrate depolymerase
MRTGRALLGIAALVSMTIGWAAYRRGYFQRVEPRREVVRVLPSETLPLLESRAAPEFAFARETVRVGERVREYYVATPRSLRKGRKLALVFVLHGDGGDGPGFQHASPFEQASGDEAIVVYPSGIGATWDIETATGNRDHALLEAIAERFVRDDLATRGRVYGTGYSSGAFVINFMACAKPGFFRAIASNAGSAPYQRAESFPNGYTKCPAQKPVPMLALHGTRDFAVTLQSGRFSADYWAYVNGCALGHWETTGYAECHAFTGCEKGNDVAYCELEGLGHWVWERHAEATWSFFRQHGE